VELEDVRNAIINGNPVIIKTESGEIRGIIAWAPPRKENKVYAVSNGRYAGKHKISSIVSIVPLGNLR
jgi:hypothetical protein